MHRRADDHVKLNLLIAPLSFSNGAIGIFKLAKATCDTHLRLPGGAVSQGRSPREARKRAQIIS
jgi:hypothetical protein